MTLEKESKNMAIKTSYKFERMERDRLKAEKKKQRLEAKKNSQSDLTTTDDDGGNETDPNSQLDD